MAFLREFEALDEARKCSKERLEMFENWGAQVGVNRSFASAQDDRTGWQDDGMALGILSALSLGMTQHWGKDGLVSWSVGQFKIRTCLVGYYEKPRNILYIWFKRNKYDDMLKFYPKTLACTKYVLYLCNVKSNVCTTFLSSRGAKRRRISWSASGCIHVDVPEILRCALDDKY